VPGLEERFAESIVSYISLACSEVEMFVKLISQAPVQVMFSISGVLEKLPVQHVSVRFSKDTVDVASLVSSHGKIVNIVDSGHVKRLNVKLIPLVIYSVKPHGESVAGYATSKYVISRIREAVESNPTLRKIAKAYSREVIPKEYIKHVTITCSLRKVAEEIYRKQGRIGRCREKYFVFSHNDRPLIVVYIEHGGVRVKIAEEIAKCEVLDKIAEGINEIGKMMLLINRII